MTERRQLKRPKISPSIAVQPTGRTSFNSGDRFNPNYSLNNIHVNPSNPRRQALEKAGLTLEAVKSLRKKADEDRSAFEARIEKWISNNDDLGDESREVWESFLNTALSIIDSGLLQPIAIRQPETPGALSTLIAGERRFLAHWLTGETTIAANIKSVNDSEASILTLIENFQREEISLEGTIIGLRRHQEQFGIHYSMSQLARIVNISKSGAQGVHHAINAEDDHPVFRELSEGTLSKPYHLYKFFQEMKKQTKTNRPNLDDASATEESNSTQENRAAEGQSRPNLDGASGEQDNMEPAYNKGQPEIERPNLDDFSGEDRVGEGASKADVNEKTSHTQDDSAKRPNLDDSELRADTAAGSTHQPKAEFEGSKNLLSAVCLDLIKLPAPEYQAISELIESASTPNDIAGIVMELATHYKE